jgi:hypothetical protein
MVGAKSGWSRVWYRAVERPAKNAVGPWGWAVHMQRENLLISTATLLGCEFTKDEWPYYLRCPDRYIIEYVPKWHYAEIWLEHHGITLEP